MIRHRPTHQSPYPHYAKTTPLPIPNTISGVCYWVDQQLLYFGHDRKTPITKRPAIKITAVGPNIYLLPATRKRKNTFYELKPDDFFVKKPENELSNNSYLSPEEEHVLDCDLDPEFGILKRGPILAVTKWLKNSKEKVLNGR